MPKVFLKKLAFGSLRPKAKQSLINAADPVQVLPDPCTGELRVHDHVSLPAVGMYSVLTLEGAKILVRYIRKLPYLGIQADPGDSSYFYVKPTLDTFEVKPGTKFTLLVGDMHFIAEIDTVLSLSPSETPRRRQPELPSAPSNLHRRNKELPTLPPSVKVQPVGLPSTPQYNCQNNVNITKSPHSNSPSPVPSPVIPRRRHVPPAEFLATERPRNVNVIRHVEADQKPPNRGQNDSESTQMRTLVEDHIGHTQSRSIAVPSTRALNLEYNSPPNRMKRTNLQREEGQDRQSFPSPRPKVVFYADDHGRALAYPSPASTKLECEGTPTVNSKAEIRPAQLSDAHVGDRHSNEPRSDPEEYLRNSTGRHTQSPQSPALDLTFEPASINFPGLPCPPRQGLNQQSAHRTALSGYKYLDATTSRPHSEKENIPSSPRQYYSLNRGEPYNKPPIKQYLPPVLSTKAAPARSSSPPASPIHSTHGAQSYVSRPLDLKSLDASNGSEYEYSQLTEKKVLAPTAAEYRQCKECGTQLNTAPSRLQSSPVPLSTAQPALLNIRYPMLERMSKTTSVAEPRSGDAQFKFVSKDIAHMAWSFPLSEGRTMILEDSVVGDHRRRPRHRECRI